MNQLNSAQVKGLVAVIALFFCGAVNTQGIIQQYEISVTVTAAPNAPGIFDNPWSFGPLPSTFMGTFDADDTGPGPISNLLLTIGGLDIVASHPVPAVFNFFDPINLALFWAQASPSGKSFVFLGDLGSLLGLPAYYAVAFDGSGLLPIDPLYNETQNWVGTYSVTLSVPDTGYTGLLLGAGLLGLAAVRRRMGRS